MKRLLEHGGSAYWNINVGSIKPHIFMLDVVRRLWRDGSCDVDAACREYVEAYYRSKDVALLITEYSASGARYGKKADDIAGDQFYHFPLRHIARALLRGDTKKALDTLRWVADEASFEAQVRRIAAVA